MLRLALLTTVALCVLGCDSSNPAAQTNAEATARNWVRVEAERDPDSATYNTEPRADGWSVLIDFRPSMPGDQVLLNIDAKGGITKVITGR